MFSNCLSFVDDRSGLARCVCYCRSCTGGWWTGVTNALAGFELMYLRLDSRFVSECRCEEYVEGYRTDYGSLPNRFCDATWRRLSLD